MILICHCYILNECIQAQKKKDDNFTVDALDQVQLKVVLVSYLNTDSEM